MSEVVSVNTSQLELDALPPRGRQRPFRRRERGVDLAAALVGLGLGVAIALAVTAQSMRALNAPGGWFDFGGRLAGLIGAYLLLVSVLLAGRIPLVERVLGHDKLVRLHRLIAPWALVLIALHGVLVVIGYAKALRIGPLHQFANLITSYPGMLSGLVAFLLLVLAAVTSARIAMRRMRYETWWAVHLYTYLALWLSLSHQILTGVMFIGHPLARAYWTALFIATGGVVLCYRVLLPLWRSFYHQLRVVSVTREGPGVSSVLLAGRRTDLMPIAGGQFVQVRVLRRGLWWQAHPYSVSALPDDRHLRLTVKEVGDHSASMALLSPGTRVAIEGPYGAFTAEARETDRVALIGAGVGVTPLRALLEDLPAQVEVVMIHRAHDERHLLLRDEFHDLMRERRGRLHELVGSRARVRLDARTLRRLVPDIAKRDVFICGPAEFTSELLGALQTLGVPRQRIHNEAFSL